MQSFASPQKSTDSTTVPLRRGRAGGERGGAAAGVPAARRQGGCIVYY
jgi:hypothetical protein